MPYVIDFSIDADGTPVVFDAPPTLENPGATYGIRQIPENTVIIGAGVGMQEASPGIYFYPFVDESGFSSAVDYEYWVRFVQDGVAGYFQGFIRSDSETPDIVDGRYATYAGMQAKFGETQLRQWGEVNGADEDAYIAAVEAAMQIADAKIDAALAGCQYAIPFTEVPLQIRDIANALAGVQLYENKGVTDFNEQTGQPIHKLVWHVKNAMSQLAQIKAGITKLTTPANVIMPGSTNYPQFSEY